MKKGANPKATDQKGNTLLHKECERENLRNVKYLIEHYDADVSAKNKKGQTPLHLACKKENNLKVVKFLIENQKADLTVTCNAGKTSFHYAAASRDSSILRYLFEVKKLPTNCTNSEGREASHLSQTNPLGCSTQTFLLKEQQKMIEAKDKNGKTALDYCFEKEKKPRVFL